MLTVNKTAYKKMLDENLTWLLAQPKTLERDHIELLLKEESKTLALYWQATNRDERHTIRIKKKRNAGRASNQPSGKP